MVVGLTGGIGAGKTSVSKLFESYGIGVFNSDEQAKALYATEELRNWLIQEFGDKIYKGEELQRQELAKVIFNDSEALKHVNAKVHPMVGEVFENWLSQQKAPYVIKEAAILIESGSYKTCDQIVLVSAPVPVRLQRVMERDGAGEEAVKARMSKQMSEDEKKKWADFVIENVDWSTTQKRTKEVHQLLLKKADLFY